MIDEGRDPREQAGDDRYAEGLFYDFAKFATGLSLILLGGVLTLGGTGAGARMRPVDLLGIVISVALAGGASFSVAYAIADARARGREPPRYLRHVMTLVAVCLGFGVAWFLMTWLSAYR